MAHNPPTDSPRPMRYQQLLRDSLQEITVRKLAKLTGIKATSLHDYAYLNVEPRLGNLLKLADYYDVHVSELLSDSDTLTARLIRSLQNMNPQEKMQLMTWINEQKSTSPPVSYP